MPIKQQIRPHQQHFQHSPSGWRGLTFLYQHFRRVGRYWYCRLIRMSDSSERLARGFAVGIFSGFFPFLGAQMFIALLLAIPFRANKLVAALGTWISNPLTYLPLYLFNFKLGCTLLGSTPDFSSEGLSSTEALFALKEEFLSALLLGCVVSGLLASAIGYLFALRSIRSWRQRRWYERTHAHNRSRPRHEPDKFDPRAIVTGKHQ